MRISAPLNSEATPILQSIEVATSLQIPSFHIIGLPSPEVAEARERIRAAIDTSGLSFPRRRVVINLSPASVRKRGTGLDLAMALAVLAASGQQDCTPAHVAAWGELGLDGAVKAAGQMTRTIYACWTDHVPFLIIPQEEYELAHERLAWIQASNELSGDPPHLIPVTSLSEAWTALSGGFTSTGPHFHKASQSAALTSGPDCQPSSTGLLALSPSLERVIGTSAAGNHHLLLLGPRGTGKSHALDWLVALQPPTSPEINVRHALISEMAVHSHLRTESHTDFKPVRRVGAQARPSALTGGAIGHAIRPGEFSLAHGGLLIADELLEWPRDSREALREPLERGLVTITRTNGTIELPARFTLAANGNLCPCGGWPAHLPAPAQSTDGTERRPPRCRCRVSVRREYLGRLSGPVLDRIDIVLLIGSSGRKRNKKPSRAETNHLETLKNYVRNARDLSIRIFGAPAGMLSASAIEKLLEKNPNWASQLDGASPQSLRARHKIVRLAISLAAWDGCDNPGAAHFMEASCYRPERYGLIE